VLVGFSSLPEVNEFEQSCSSLLSPTRTASSALDYAGAKGYRLDVADELPDEVLAMIYKVARQTDPEAVLLGEVWEDATTKYSYGAKRHYALGVCLIRSLIIRCAMPWSDI